MVDAAKFIRGLMEILVDLSIPPATCSLQASHLLMHCLCRICNSIGEMLLKCCTLKSNVS